VRSRTTSADHSFDKLKDYLALQRQRVDKALDKQLVGARVMPPVIHEAMRYSVFAGGKRLRPVLCLAAAEFAGAPWERAMPTACALEMIHTYSLVHDDLPAMDDDDFRRGMPTCHKKYGEAVAILAGDGLLTQAFKTLAANAALPGVKPATVVKVIDTVAEAAGSTGMVGGQVKDLEMAHQEGSKEFRRQSLDYIHRHKTSALIQASLKAGALIAQADNALLAALDRYGESIGLAFQITDDVLDIVGNKALLGKRGSDRENGKLTFPALYGLDVSRRMAQLQIDRAKQALRPHSAKAQIFYDLADYIVQRKN